MHAIHKRTSILRTSSRPRSLLAELHVRCKGMSCLTRGLLIGKYNELKINFWTQKYKLRLQKWCKFTENLRVDAKIRILKIHDELASLAHCQQAPVPGTMNRMRNRRTFDSYPSEAVMAFWYSAHSRPMFYPIHSTSRVNWPYYMIHMDAILFVCAGTVELRSALMILLMLRECFQE